MISGDTIKIQYQNQASGKLEPLQVILDMIKTPKTALRKSGDEDAFGWEAKELMRSKVVTTPTTYLAFRRGKLLPTSTKLDPKLPKLPDRYFANVVILDAQGNSANNIDLAEMMVAEGLAEVKELRRDRFKTFENGKPMTMPGAPADADMLSEADVMKVDPSSLHPIDLRWRKLKELEIQAENQKKGKFRVAETLEESMKHMRAVEWISPRREDTQKAIEFYKMAQGRPLDAIVTMVREGTVIQLEVLPDDKFTDNAHRMVFANILGIKSPSIPIKYELALRNWDNNPGNRPKPTEQSQAPEKFAVAAMEHTRGRLLCQRVKVNFKLCDDRGNLYAEVILFINGQARNIAPSLVSRGYSVVVPWHASKAECKGMELQKYQMDAIKKKAGVWSVNPADRATTFKSLKGLLATTAPVGVRGKVIAIRNGDAVALKIDGKERVYYLASIRSFREGFGPGDANPKMPSRNASRSLYKTINMSKDFLRKLTIGQMVEVETEYTRELAPRPGSNKTTTEVRTYASIFTLNKLGHKEKNLARELVAEGLAETLGYDPKNQQRSKYYDQLLEAAVSAKEMKKGKHNPGFKEDKFMDLSLRGPELGKQCQNLLRAMWSQYGKEGNKALVKSYVNATVEYVFGGHKVKVIIDMSQLGPVDRRMTPKRAVALFLEGIECTRGKMGDKSKWNDLDMLNETTGNKAKAYVEELINQREVRVKITGCDSKFNLLGSIIVKEGRKNVDIRKQLIEMGLAKCRQFNVSPELVELQKAAQEAKKGYWEFTEVEKKEVKKAEEVEAAPVQVLKEDESIYVTHIQDGATFYVRKHPCPRNANIEKALSGYPAAASRKRPPFAKDAEKPTFKRKDCLAGKYGNDYFRCRVEKAIRQETGAPKYHVKFLDYGNEVMLNYTDLEFLPESIHPTKISPLCQKLTLAFLSPPPRESQGDVYYNAGSHLNHLVLEKTFKIKRIEYSGRDYDNNGVDLLDGDDSINQKMASYGLCRLSNQVKKVYMQDINKKRGRLTSATKAYVKSLIDQENEARKMRRGMYRHGDVDGDSDQD